MRYLLLSLVHLIFLVVCDQSGQAQNVPLFSAPFVNQQVYNPARVGLNQEFNEFTILHRSSYVGYDGDFGNSTTYPNTSTLTVGIPIVNKNIGLGFTGYFDQIGQVESSRGILQFSYHAKFRRGMLSLGLGAGITRRQFDIRSRDFVDPSEPLFAGDNASNLDPLTSPIGQLGVTYVTNTLFAAYSTDLNFVSSVSDGVQTSIIDHHYLDLGYNFFLGIANMLTPRVLVRTDGVVVGVQYGVEASINDNRVSLAAFMRDIHTFTGIVGYSLNKSRTVEAFLSVDASTSSELRNATELLSSEVIVRFKTKAFHLRKGRPVRTPRYKFE